MTQIIEMLVPKGTNARPGLALTPQYITIHNTANTARGAGAVSHGKYLQGAGSAKYVSYHYAVDDTAIVRILPENEVAWHAGDGASGTGNRKSLAIEICENPESSLAVATDNAAALAAQLMQRHAIPLQNVVQHNRWSGKNCPSRLRRGEPYDWATFIAKVSGFYAALQPAQSGDGALYAVQTGAFASRENAEAYAAQLRAKGVETYVTRKEV